MGMKSNLAVDPVAHLDDDRLPPIRVQRFVKDVDESQVAATVEEPGVQVRTAEAGDDVAQSPGGRSRVGLLLAVVVVTIGPCGALLVALGSPHFDLNSQREAMPVATASPALQLVLDDQPSPLPELTPAPSLVTVTDGMIDTPSDHAPSRTVSKPLSSKRHSPRHTVTVAVRPVTNIAAEDQHGGPYARTGNGPGSFFHGDR